MEIVAQFAVNIIPEARGDLSISIPAHHFSGPEMIDLNNVRKEFAAFLSADPGRFRMDAALAHVVTMAYQQGIKDAQAVPPPAEPIKVL